MWSLVATILAMASATNDPNSAWCRAAIISDGNSVAEEVERFWSDTSTWANAALPKPGARVLDKYNVGASIAQVVLNDTNANIGSMNLKNTVVKLSGRRRLVLSSPVCSSPTRRRAQCSTDLLLLEYLRIISAEDGNVEVECDFDLVMKDGGDTSRKVWFVCTCVCVYVRVHVSVYLSVYLSVCMYVCLYACMCMTISENVQ